MSLKIIRAGLIFFFFFFFRLRFIIFGYSNEVDVRNFFITIIRPILLFFFLNAILIP